MFVFIYFIYLLCLPQLPEYDCQQENNSVPDLLFRNTNHIDVSTGLNTAMVNVVKRVNYRSDWQDANQ